MSDSDAKQGKHYAVKVENLKPTLIVCVCGARFNGDDAIELQKLHMKLQDGFENFEEEWERRNVFDQNDKDKESP